MLLPSSWLWLFRKFAQFYQVSDEDHWGNGSTNYTNHEVYHWIEVWSRVCQLCLFGLSHVVYQYLSLSPQLSDLFWVASYNLLQLCQQLSDLWAYISFACLCRHGLLFYYWSCSRDWATCARDEASFFSSFDQPLLHCIVWALVIELLSRPIRARLEFIKSRVAICLHERGNCMRMWAIDFVKHYFAFVSICKFINNLVPFSLELLTPITVLHIQIKDDNFIGIRNL